MYNCQVLHFFNILICTSHTEVPEKHVGQP